MPSALFVTTVPITLEAFLLPFADHFRSEGWRVDALANGAAGLPALDGHFDERFDVAWSRNPLAPSNLIGTSRRVREVVVAGGYDIVHVHTPIAAFVTRYALSGLREQPGGPVVIYTAHGFHFYRGQGALGRTFFRSMERAAAPWTDYLVTINQEDFTAAKALGGIAPDRVRLIPGIGVDCNRFTPGTLPAEQIARTRIELGGGATPPDGFLITMVAEFGAVKRHALAIDAFSRVTDARAHLALVGDGPLEADVRAQVTRLGLADRVTFVGYRRDIPAVLEASDALLLTSEREGLNRSVLEAMASGRPIVGTDTRGITDAVGDKAGWIVGHNDAAGLAAAIDAAAADPGELARRGAVARQRACTEFALDTIVTAYDGLYREALAHRL
ncbi:MAG: glycosyltransferase [Coriobacteriia bacterium]|nr:glycosyltransferase [Coriobacteriia bacterium]